jgi:hypothetical protein
MYKSNESKSTASLVQRLVRLESKLVRGFEELGVSVDADHDWISVEDETNTVYISTLGRSLTVIMQEMKARGATKESDWYDVVHKGHVVATIMYEPKF